MYSGLTRKRVRYRSVPALPAGRAAGLINRFDASQLLRVREGDFDT
jgi:hypothetical protein